MTKVSFYCPHCSAQRKVEERVVELSESATCQFCDGKIPLEEKYERPPREKENPYVRKSKRRRTEAKKKRGSIQFVSNKTKRRRNFWEISGGEYLTVSVLIVIALAPGLVLLLANLFPSLFSQGFGFIGQFFIATMVIASILWTGATILRLRALDYSQALAILPIVISLSFLVIHFFSFALGTIFVLFLSLFEVKESSGNLAAYRKKRMRKRKGKGKDKEPRRESEAVESQKGDQSERSGERGEGKGKERSDQSKREEEENLPPHLIDKLKDFD